MAEKLTDPSKPAHEITKVLEDGDAIRNDGVRLTAANKNPWYVLATIYGEQPTWAVGWKHCKKLAARNRRAWNGWFCGHLNDEERADRAFKTGLEQDDLAPLGNAELKEIEKRFASRMGKGAKLPRKDEIIDFSYTVFSKFACFEKFVFENKCNFRSAGFKKTGYFCSSVFIKEAYFRSAVFMSHAGFASVTFCNYAGFRSALFCEEASFKQYEGRDNKRADNPVRFFHCANFSSANFLSTTRFNEAQFLTHVPEFHAAELYDDTVFPTPDKYTDNWPPLKDAVKVEGQDKPVKVMPTADQKRAYNRLRLFMNRSLQMDEEQFFHRQEMRCKRENEEKRWMRCLYDLFEGVSDYGNSLERPVYWLVVFWLSGMIAKLKPVADGWWPDYHSILPAMGWSFANLFSFFGFQRRYFGEEKLIMALQVVGGVQTVAGFILLFFFGLGLRNRFRLR